MKKKWRLLPPIAILLLIAGYLIVHDGKSRSTDSTKEGTGNHFYHQKSLHKDWLNHESQSQFQSVIHTSDEDVPHNFKINVGKDEDVKIEYGRVTKKPLIQATNSIVEAPNTSSTLDQELRKVLNNIDRCLDATNLKRIAHLEATAKKNAALYLKEYRKVIPRESYFLHSNCSSHCWATNYDVERQGDKVKGHIGNTSFQEDVKDVRKFALNILHREFYNKFTSKVVCLPEIFLAGFPKCGSSFLWCFMNRLVQSENVHAEKEPHFWIDGGAYKHFRKPTASDFGEYILNFANGITRVDKGRCASRGVLLMDGSPNLMFNWPRFDMEDVELANYCLIPSTLPHFLPAAKFIVVMRNPIKMLYSAFWFSCTMYGIKLSPDIQLKGPTLFHDRIDRKISLFIDCMRDKDNPHPCSVNDSNYNSCITERLHMLDECVQKISFNIFGEVMPKCGRSRVAMGIYFAHIRKWLSVVPREKFLFLTLEELIEDPFEAARTISRFLGYKQSVKDIQNSVHFASLCNENSQNSINYKTNPKLHMRTDTRNMLETFYRPFNEHLANLLQNSKFLWT